MEQTYSLYTEEELRFIEETSRSWYESSEYGLVGNFWGAGFGDIATVPGPAVLHPKGIRDPEEWYVSTLTRKDYVKEIFRLQLELQMKNLAMYRQAVGDRIDVVVMSGTDFGSQNGPFISPDAYREIFKPLHADDERLGARSTRSGRPSTTPADRSSPTSTISPRPASTSSTPCRSPRRAWHPRSLKDEYGEQFVFWGGAVDAQHTLAFGTAGAGAHGDAARIATDLRQAAAVSSSTTRTTSRRRFPRRTCSPCCGA